MCASFVKADIFVHFLRALISFKLAISFAGSLLLFLVRKNFSKFSLKYCSTPGLGWDSQGSGK